jgi:hypothetical protein
MTHIEGTQPVSEAKTHSLNHPHASKGRKKQHGSHLLAEEGGQGMRWYLAAARV